MTVLLHRAAVALAVVLAAPALAQEHGIVGPPPVLDVRPPAEPPQGAVGAPAELPPPAASTGISVAADQEGDGTRGLYRPPPRDGEGDPR